MTNSLPDAFIFMKVGNHARESFEQILERKRREIVDAGVAFWGYGGTTLHPITRVQPFARTYLRQQGTIYLVMEAIESKADPDIVPAKEFSEDGIHWNPLPRGVTVTGSRYALVLDEINPGDLIFPMGQFSVGIGMSQGKPADEYLRGRIDKGCFVKQTNGSVVPDNQNKVKTISYVARLESPFGVMLR